jgi:hypothetical protein
MPVVDTDTIATAAATGVVGLLILVTLWPGPKHGRRLLHRWGIPQPDAAEVATAVRYLRRRRLWYPWLYVAIPLLPIGFDSFGGTVLTTLLAGGLLAELLAQRRSREPVREAMLASRSLGGFLPVWITVLTAVVMVAALAHLAVDARWTLFGVCVLAAAVAWGIALLAVRRPPAGTIRVDAALRHRSARVALGLGAAACTAISWQVGDFGSFVAVVVGIATFLAVVTPPKTAQARTP